MFHGYCERTGDAFWAEPLNALTNVAFLVAAVAAFVRAKRVGRMDAGIGLLIALTTAIGVGSFLFHTLATPWAALADVLPILLFIVAYLALVCRRFFALGWPSALLIGVLYIPASMGLRLLWRKIAGGAGATGGYLPAIVVLLIVAGLLARRRHQAARPLALAGALFALSLTLRSLDLPLCAAVPIENALPLAPPQRRAPRLADADHDPLHGLPAPPGRGFAHGAGTLRGRPGFCLRGSRRRRCPTIRETTTTGDGEGAERSGRIGGEEPVCATSATIGPAITRRRFGKGFAYRWPDGTGGSMIRRRSSASAPSSSAGPGRRYGYRRPAGPSSGRRPRRPRRKQHRYIIPTGSRCATSSSSTG